MITPGQAMRAQTVFERPRSQTTSASRSPPTIVRRPSLARHAVAAPNGGAEGPRAVVALSCCASGGVICGDPRARHHRLPPTIVGGPCCSQGARGNTVQRNEHPTNAHGVHNNTSRVCSNDVDSDQSKSKPPAAPHKPPMHAPVVARSTGVRECALLRRTEKSPQQNPTAEAGSHPRA